MVSIIIPAYNEEAVIEQKVLSVIHSDFPLKNIEIFIGSDASTDKTNSIIRNLSLEYSIIKPYFFNKRKGKPSILNTLVKEAQGEILILTDANVIFKSNTISELLKYFKNDSIGLVDAHMLPKNSNNAGISLQEQSYIAWEVLIKNFEGLIWGSMMGPFGGCYAIRRNLFFEIPNNFLVDDFYINMKVLESGKFAINNLNACVVEDVSNDLKAEFRRKVRISSGNFQNLAYFKKMLWPIWKPVAFCFFSHKVLRWIAPFLLLLLFILNLLLAGQNTFYKITLILQLVLYTIPLIDYLLRKLNIHIVLLRFATHFISMNAALLVGFIKYMKGTKTNVWEPTQRNQQ